MYFLITNSIVDFYGCRHLVKLFVIEDHKI